MISKSSIEDFDESKVAWQYLSDNLMERKWESSPGMGIIYPPGTTLFQTWIPPTGGLYRLSLVCFPLNELTNRDKVQSGAFRVSSGPPLRHEDLPVDTNHMAPTNLINRIANCDHIIVTNRFAAIENQTAGFSEKITGPEMTRIVQAVSSLWILGHESHTTAACDWELQFFQGTNHLDVVNFQGSIVRYDDQDYPDRTGVFDKLSTWVYDKLYSRHLRQRSQ